MVMQACGLLFGEKPQHQNAWRDCQKMLSNPAAFLAKLHGFDFDSADKAVVELLNEKFVKHPAFQLDKMKISSRAGVGLCKWVRAVVAYHCGEVVVEEAVVEDVKQNSVNCGSPKMEERQLLLEKETQIANDPAMAVALKALAGISKGHIQEVKALSKPPVQLAVVGAAVCILLGGTTINKMPVPIPDVAALSALSLGEIIHGRYWKSTQKIMCNPMAFLAALKSVHKNDISSAVVELIREKFLGDEMFQVENMRKVLMAGVSLLIWARAMVEEPEAV
jgi:hypothetical protein